MVETLRPADLDTIDRATQNMGAIADQLTNLARQTRKTFEVAQRSGINGGVPSLESLTAVQKAGGGLLRSLELQLNHLTVGGRDAGETIYIAPQPSEEMTDQY